MGCVASSSSSSSSSKVSNAPRVPNKKLYQRKENIRKAQLEKKSKPDNSLNTSKITSTVYRLHPDSTPTIKEKKKQLLYLADKGTFLSPPSSPMKIKETSLLSVKKADSLSHNNNPNNNNSPNNNSNSDGNGSQSPTSPALVFTPSKPFSVINRLEKLYKKLRYQLGPMSDDEITHDEERHEAMMLYGQQGGGRVLESAVKLLNENEDNLFLHKIVWRSICLNLIRMIKIKADIFTLIDTIVAAFYGNDAAFFAFTSAQSCAIYSLFLCTTYHGLTIIEKEEEEKQQQQQGDNNSNNNGQRQKSFIKLCYGYLTSNDKMKDKSGLSIIRTLLHTYIVNRYIFNIHYSTLYRDTKYNENHSKGDISKEAVLDHIYNWAMQWLANDKQNIETSKVLSIPPSPTNKDDVNNNNNDDKKTHGNNDDDGLIENNALETYEKQINASQDLYNRLRADIKQQKASVDDDFDDEQDNNNDDIRDTSLKNNNSEKEDGQYVIDYEIVRVLEFNRSDPHIFMQLYTHWRKEKYTPEHLVDMNALTCVLGVLQRANPENIIYGSIVVAATMCLLYTMEGPNAYERLIRSETKRLEKEENMKKHMQLKTDVENYSHGISKISLTNTTNNNKNVRALQTLANAGSTIHDAYIWADSNSELFPNTRKRIQSEKIESIFSNGLPQIFFED